MREKLSSLKILWLSLVVAISLFLLLSSLLLKTLTVKGEESPFAEAPLSIEQQGELPVINGHGTGYQPPPMDLSHLTGQTMPDVQGK